MTAREFCKDNLDDIHGMSRDVIESHIDFATMHVEAALKSVLKKLSTSSDNWEKGDEPLDLDKLILNAYPLTNIK